MRKIVPGLVMLAALTGAAPAFSSTGTAGLDKVVEGKGISMTDANAPSQSGYWTAKSEYYVSTSDGRSFVRSDGRKLRRVMISGYHPVEGFASEVAAEADATARWDARSTY